MIKDLKYNGHTAIPSDYECNDGDLAISIGVIPEDGALKPVLQPSEVLELSEGDSVVYIHKTSNFTHYVVHNDRRLRWEDANTHEGTVLHIFGIEIYQVTAIGNTLVVLVEDGIHYFLWQGNEAEYMYMGNKIPECPISFGLRGEIVPQDEKVSITFPEVIPLGNVSRKEKLSDANISALTDAIKPKINKFINEECVEKNRFIFPFFVRYALRLYDGSLMKHSAPILMLPTLGIAPEIDANLVKNSNDDYTSGIFTVIGYVSSLDYALINADSKTELEKWSDVVQSVDVFISQPIYTYNQGGDCEYLYLDGNWNDKAACIAQYRPYSASGTPTYKRFEFREIYSDGVARHSVKLSPPMKGDGEIFDDIENCGNFYFLKSIKLKELSSERRLLEIPDNYMVALATREVMTDDYDSHDILVPKYAFGYNSRLNLANIRKSIFDGFTPKAMFGYNDYNPDNVEVFIYIKADGKDVVVKQNSTQMGTVGSLIYFYYPNPKAYKAIVSEWSYPNEYYPYKVYYEVELKPHPMLNGAYFFSEMKSVAEIGKNVGGFNKPPYGVLDVPISSEKDKQVTIFNKIYTSEINNPFLFPLLGINTVGTGEIIGISTAAKALSEGQFGQFPLYAFTSEGVWALEVSGTGSYTTKQPVTRDVCINADSITQIDSAVLFATNRGIMLISGSQVQCITDTINAPDLFSIEDLPKYEGLVSVFNKNATSREEHIHTDSIKMMPFLDFLSGCQMIYDYTHQRIIVYNPKVLYAYVYSLKSRMWGMMLSFIYDKVNSYPEALAMLTIQKTVLSDNGQETTSIVPILADFSQSSVDCSTGLIITRPFNMDNPDIFKTIDTIIQRGFFKSGNIKQVLYGSNDLYNWHVVWSSNGKFMRGFRGTPYKAFRLAVVCMLNKDENLLGCTIQFNPRRLNQPR